MFRQVGVDLDGTPAFAYCLGPFVFVNPVLQFGWRGSSGWWDLVAGTVQDAQREMTTAVDSPAAAAATAVVSVTPVTGRPVADIPPECTMPTAVSGRGGSARGGHCVGSVLC